MGYTKKTWADGEVITDDALNNIEGGIAANDAALATKADAATAATKQELVAKADKTAIADMLTKAEATKTYATKTEAATKAEVNAKAKKVAGNVDLKGVVPSAAVPTKQEFDKAVEAIKSIAAKLDAMNA